MDGKEIEFRGGFTDLLSIAYAKILEGKGYGLEAARNSIGIVYNIRNSEPLGLTGDYHPIIKSIQT